MYSVRLTFLLFQNLERRDYAMAEPNEPKQKWEDLVERLIAEGILQSPRVIRALRRARRDQFVPEQARAYAAVDTPLSIGYGQTVSAPLG